MSDHRLTASDQRALDLVLSGELREDTRARSFPYVSPDGTQHKLTIFGDDTWSCTCKAGAHGTPCYALKAARQIIQREDQAVMARAGKCSVLPTRPATSMPLLGEVSA